MTTNTLMCGFLIIAISFILAVVGLCFVIFLRKLPNVVSKNDICSSELQKWYEEKFQQLVALIGVGLVFVTVVMGFLALLPRYDFEQAKEQIEKDFMEHVQKTNESISSLKSSVIAIDKKLDNSPNSKSFSLLEQKVSDIKWRLDKYPSADYLISVLTQTKHGSIPQAFISQVDENKSNTIKVDAIQVDTPKVDAIKVDAIKVDAIKVDAIKVDTPKVDAIKVDIP